MVTAPPPTLSAIIATLNRAQALSNTLAAMAELDLQGLNFELIVVYQDNTDGSREVLKTFAATAPFPVRAVFQCERSTSSARNHALRLARGDVFIITDDDVIVERNWAQATAKLFAENQHILVGGKAELYSDDLNSDSIRLGDAPDQTTDLMRLFDFVIGCNMACSRSVIEQIGGFDERLGPGTPIKASEDSDFVGRVLAAGIPVLYAPSISVRHNHGRTTVKQRVKLLKGYSIGMGATLAKLTLRLGQRQARPVYWAVRSTFKFRVQQMGLWTGMLMNAYIIYGVVRFLFIDMHKPAHENRAIRQSI